MASDLDREQLLEGVVEGDPWKAFGLAYTLTLTELRRECRIKQSEFHQDKGNPTLISQLANDCASVICGRQHAVSHCLQIAAKIMLYDLRADYNLKRKREWVEQEKKDRYDRVVSQSNVEKAKILLGSFEKVSRSDASKHTDIRQLFRRAFALGNHEAGILMKAIGIQSVMNYKRSRVAIFGTLGLKVSTPETKQQIPVNVLRVDSAGT